MQLGGRTIRGLLIDLDGVLYVGGQVIPGAVETVAALRRNEIPHVFLTNTTTQPIAALHAKLTGMGFDVRPDEIVSAPQAARIYLEGRGRPTARLLLNEQVAADFADYPCRDSGVEAVVLGDIGDAWTYDLLNEVFRELMAGAELVALHRNRYWQTETGLQMDIGAFVAGLEYVTGREATVIGKPAPAFFHAALARAGLAAEETGMIGDDADTDVGAAQQLGLTGILVRTGKYREEHVRKSGVQPDLTLDSFAELRASLD